MVAAAAAAAAALAEGKTTDAAVAAPKMLAFRCNRMSVCCDAWLSASLAWLRFLHLHKPLF